MKELSPLEKKIHNAGERLIPGVTHDILELVRHRSSYLFFRQVIEHDMATRASLEPIRIVDLGCGVGHGCETLSDLPNVQVVGVDSSPESIEFARTHYARENITYEVADLVEYVPSMLDFDYVVSRNVFEHVPDGLRMALSTKWRYRLLFDVPYDEPEGRNPHHALSGIREESFAELSEGELFFQDMQGVIYGLWQKPPQPNVIICVASRSGLERVRDSGLTFPLQGAWQELPLVSVVTPAYNRAAYLDEVIQSVLDQDYPNVEYIVLDDGSTDGTPDIIKRYAGKIRWESHANMGETRTVNKGFNMVNGEIIGVVNSDDPLLPRAITTIVSRLLAEPDTLVAYPDWLMIDENGESFKHITTYDYNYTDMLRWHHCVPGPGAFFRRTVVEELGGRDPDFRFVGDFDFWLRAGLLGPFTRVPATLATFRYHPESYSISQLGQEMAKEHVRLTDKIFAIPSLPPEARKVKREAYSSTYYIAGAVCGTNASPDLRRGYFLLALWYAPHKYLLEYRKRWRTMAPLLLDRFYYPLAYPAKFMFHQLHRIVGRLMRYGKRP